MMLTDCHHNHTDATNYFDDGEEIQMIECLDCGDVWFEAVD